MSKSFRKRWRKKLRPARHLLVYWLVAGVCALFRMYPAESALALGELLGKLAYFLASGTRRKTLAHLELALGGETTPQQRRRIAKEVFVNVGRLMAEAAFFGRWSKEELSRRVIDDCSAKLSELRRGKGVVMLGAHFGNWELVAGYLSLVAGLPISLVAREMSNQRLDDFMIGLRNSMGIETCVRGKSARQYFRHLRRNNILGILADLDTKQGQGTFVDFFGHPAHTQEGVYQLPLRTGASVIMVFAVRQPDRWRHRLVLSEEIPVPAGGDPQQDARIFLQRITGEIEKIVRRHPEQWMWLHERWKRQPEEETETA